VEESMEVKEREVTSTPASSMINPIITTTVYIKGRCHEIWNKRGKQASSMINPIVTTTV
jgi:hypothetical protein